MTAHWSKKLDPYLSIEDMMKTNKSILSHHRRTRQSKFSASTSLAETKLALKHYNNISTFELTFINSTSQLLNLRVFVVESIQKQTLTGTENQKYTHH